MKPWSWLFIAAFVALAAGCSKPADTDSSSAASAASVGSGATPASAASAGVSATSSLDAGPRAGESPADEELAEQGEKLFKDKGCSACHAFGRRLTGPDLAGVSMRRTAGWIEQQILNPARMVKEDPIARQLFAQFALQMPNQGLTRAEALAIIEYFKHQEHESEDH